jgi:hypothetical protein
MAISETLARLSGLVPQEARSTCGRLPAERDASLDKSEVG